MVLSEGLVLVEFPLLSGRQYGAGLRESVYDALHVLFREREELTRSLG